MLLHGEQQVQRGGEVVAIVFQRHLHALANRLKPRKVDHGVDGIAGKERVGLRGIREIDLFEIKRLGGQGAQARERRRLAVDEVISNQHVITRVEKL